MNAPSLVEILDATLPSVDLPLCEHGDEDECEICLYSLDAGRDFDDSTIIITRSGHS